LGNAATLAATWITGTGCVIMFTDRTIMLVTFIYTMIFDFIILLLAAVKLFKTMTAGSHPLTRLVFKDGLIYFNIA
jgi:hypothetical protein